MSTSWPQAPPPVAIGSALPPRPLEDRTKVLHVITRLIAGAGANTVVSAIGTDPDRYEMWLAGGTGDGMYEPSLWKRAETHGVRTVEMPRFKEVISPTDDMIVLIELVRLIRRERFAVVHTHSTKAGILGRLAARICRTPVVIHTIHGASTHRFMPRSRRLAYLAIERAVRPLAHAFLAVAPAVAQEAVETRVAPPGRISVVPSAVDLGEVPAATNTDARHELGIPVGAPLIGTAGRLDYQKAPLDFVRMAAVVREAHADARFVMMGNGPLLDAARDEAERLGVDVSFTGFREDAARLAAGFDVFVISSLYEGLGRALTEALASQRPVAATAVNGVVDIVEHGATGLLSSPADPESLARNVIWLLDHPDEARRMGEAGAKRVRSLFDPDLMCALIEQAYARLLGQPGNNGATGSSRRAAEDAQLSQTGAVGAAGASSSLRP